MKKLLTVALTVLLLFALAVPAFANPNSGPGSASVRVNDEVSVLIEGNGNRARLVVVIGQTRHVQPSRPSNNENNRIVIGDLALDVFVRGNSIMSAVIVVPGETQCNHNWKNSRVTTAATCDTPGIRTLTCSRCNETTTISVPALGHRVPGNATGGTKGAPNNIAASGASVMCMRAGCNRVID